MYDALHIDAFHALFMCPLVSPERAVMWQTLDALADAGTQHNFDTVTDLGISLLYYVGCPNVPAVARAVGRFLSECLAARELYSASRDGRVDECNPKWLRGRTDKLNSMKHHVVHLMDCRGDATSPLPIHNCAVANAWVNRNSCQPLCDAFRVIRSWLTPA